LRRLRDVLEQVVEQRADAFDRAARLAHEAPVTRL